MMGAGRGGFVPAYSSVSCASIWCWSLQDLAPAASPCSMRVGRGSVAGQHHSHALSHTDLSLSLLLSRSHLSPTFVTFVPFTIRRRCLGFHHSLKACSLSLTLTHSCTEDAFALHRSDRHGVKASDSVCSPLSLLLSAAQTLNFLLNS
jgi:hypothetical protein